MRISDWSSDVCSSDLAGSLAERGRAAPDRAGEPGAGPAFRRGRRKHRLHSRLGMTAMQRNLRFKLTAALSLALATAACAADPERSKEAQAIADTINLAFHHPKRRQVPSTPENQAETVVFEQRVAFGPDTELERKGVGQGKKVAGRVTQGGRPI